MRPVKLMGNFDSALLECQGAKHDWQCENAGAVIGIAGLGFALTKLDPGFSKVLYETVIKVRHLPMSDVWTEWMQHTPKWNVQNSLHGLDS